MEFKWRRMFPYPYPNGYRKREKGLITYINNAYLKTPEKKGVTVTPKFMLDKAKVEESSPKLISLIERMLLAALALAWLHRFCRLQVTSTPMT